MRSILQCILQIGYGVVSCVSSQNNVCDDEYVEQYQKYDVRYHVCCSIACVEWTLYAHCVAMSIDQ